ncbi:carboxymethylenebutenolidase [Bradyrhizobium sacchari]|uniref:Carboxymethylenebutenolidase n=1 Tax=Bradyrhizobium sacchari TaxID=1399419 RepID=A0A560JP78_9BRAD|nr:dienelactone hydrolase family protein [Bradyrhizobium sacchari]OPY98468.1 carboxymethylenebutenolidase [Bradyrhizobium sacchari]TWB57007.1 carboxymethylenebutenolidase [Bradyrhizobium sacchari]TWB71284.1 carboxymethylenebutenolidase [Bradyrhizobium sacchari]
MIELTASDGASFTAYRAEPAETPRGAVVVLQDVFGVTPEIRKVADAFAARGYVAIAPSLFDRVKPGVRLAHDEDGKAEGAAISAQVGKEQAISDIQTTVNAAKEAGKVAVVGYCWGGDLAYAAANKVNGIACVIGYDGAETVTDYREKRKVPTLLHFGESDPELPLEAITQFRAWRPDVSAFTYPGATHGFGCDERGSFCAEAAEKALERTIFWISQYVEGQQPILLKNAGAYAQAKTEKKKKKKSDDLGPPVD